MSTVDSAPLSEGLLGFFEERLRWWSLRCALAQRDVSEGGAYGKRREKKIPVFPAGILSSNKPLSREWTHSEI